MAFLVSAAVALGAIIGLNFGQRMLASVLAGGLSAGASLAALGDISSNVAVGALLLFAVCVGIGFAAAFFGLRIGSQASDT
jgi:hypothetical protein